MNDKTTARDMFKFDLGKSTNSTGDLPIMSMKPLRRSPYLPDQEEPNSQNIVLNKRPTTSDKNQMMIMPRPN